MVGAALMALVVSTAEASAATLLPDLGMARLSDFRIETTASGAKRLRYTAIIVNVGQGQFRLEGQRASTTSPFVVNQRIYDSAGVSTTVPTSAAMYFAGDGHAHWHVRDLETGFLVRPSDNAKLRAVSSTVFASLTTTGTG